MAAAVEAYSKCAGAVKMLRALAAEKRAAQAGVTDEVVERALRTRVPGGAEVGHWLPQTDDGKPHDTARAVVRAALEAVWSSGKDAQDAKRYRWLRQHFRFANDSLHELWFDASLEPDDAGVPVDLDQELDTAMQGANDMVSGGGTPSA